jgi:signal peptidase II
MVKKLLIPLVSCILLVALDQWVKLWAVAHLKGAPGRDVIGGFLGLTYVENQGAAFGMFQGGRWFFVAVTIAVLAGVAVYYIKLPRTPVYWAVRVPLIFVFAGAVGNFIDRVRQGFVVDMFEFLFISFPVFNVADICLVAGTIVLAFMFLFVIKE